MKSNYEQAALVFKALSDPNRLAVIDMIKNEEKDGVGFIACGCCMLLCKRRYYKGTFSNLLYCCPFRKNPTI